MRPAWGAVALGAMAGIGIALAIFVAVGVSGMATPTGLAVASLFGQFLALFVAGYVTGRLTGPHAVFNGGLSGLLVFAIVVAVSVSGGPSPGVGALLLLGVVAAVAGSAGGVLALHLRR